MNSTEDLYSVVSESIAVLRKRYLYHTDHHFCAAFLLDTLYADIARKNIGNSITGESNDFTTSTSLDDLVNGLYGMYENEDIIESLNILIGKGYISIKETNAEQDWYTFNIHKKYIDSISQQYYAKIRKQQEEHKRLHPFVPQSTDNLLVSTPREIPLAEKHKTEAAKVAYQCRRAEDIGLSATLTLEEWIETLIYFDHKCAYCLGKYTVLEHFIPLVHGGGTTKSNCVPSCHKCNGLKGTLHPSMLTSGALRKFGNNIQTIKDYLETKGHVEEGAQ